MSSNSSTMTGDSLEVLGSRWGPERREMEEKIAETAKGRWKSRRTGMCRFRILAEQRRGRTEEVYWGGGENHVAEGTCSVE